MGRSTVLDQILVIDLECTCWRDKPPTGMRNEIIEIGMCPVDLGSFEIGQAASIIVKPEHSAVSEFCTELTTLTQEEVNGGTSLRRSIGIMQLYYPGQALKNRVWASYGDFDREHLQSECWAKHIRYPFGKTHLNVKNLLALSRDWEHEVGMKKALEILGIELEGTHHRGVDDARNIAKILVHVLRKLRG